jgi:two-component system chemotaxis response regulator CheY
MQVLLGAVDGLRDLIQHSDDVVPPDHSTLLASLDALHAKDGMVSNRNPPPPQHLRALLVEDDFASRLMLQSFLARYGDCHVAVNGREAVDACRAAMDGGRSYHVICMDIMMPEMDGREAARQIREMEEKQGILSTDGVKIIMTTTVGEIREVMHCFHALCDAYLLKPIDLSQLLRQMKAYRLVP